MKDLIMKIPKMLSFSPTLLDEAEAELIKAQRELLRHQTVIENYTAAAEAAEKRIVRLKQFLNDNRTGVAFDPTR